MHKVKCDIISEFFWCKSLTRAWELTRRISRLLCSHFLSILVLAGLACQHSFSWPSKISRRTCRHLQNTWQRNPGNIWKILTVPLSLHLLQTSDKHPCISLPFCDISRSLFVPYQTLDCRSSVQVLKKFSKRSEIFNLSEKKGNIFRLKRIRIKRSSRAVCLFLFSSSRFLSSDFEYRGWASVSKLGMK